MKLDLDKKHLGLIIFPFILPLPIPLIYSSIALGLMLLNLALFFDYKKIKLNTWFIIAFSFVFIDVLRSIVFEGKVIEGFNSVKLSFLFLPIMLFGVKLKINLFRRKLLISFTFGVLFYLLYAIGYLVYFYIKYAKWYTFSFTDHYVIYILYNYLPGAYHHTYIGLYLAFASIIVLQEFKTSTIRIYKLFLGLIIFIFFLMQFYVGSKMTMLLSFLGSILYLGLSRLNMKKIIKIFIGLSGLFISFAFLVKDWLFLSITNSINYRVAYAKKSIELIEENIWFGIGVRNIKKTEVLINGEIKPLIPHNLYLHELLANGIFGLLLLMFMICFLLKMGLKAKDHLLITLVSMFILLGFTEDFLCLQRGVFFFLFFTTIFLASNKNYKKI